MDLQQNAIINTCRRMFPGPLVREVEPSETDPELRSLEITNEVISILEDALNGYLSDEQKNRFLPDFKDKITAPVEKSLKTYDRNRYDQNIALEWENQSLRNERKMPRDAAAEYLYRVNVSTAKDFLSLPYKHLRPTSEAPRGETLLGIRDDLERKLETFQDFMESNVWKRVETDLAELDKALRTVQSRANFQADENKRLREKIEELENRDYELLVQQLQLDISELENACETLESSLESRTSYEVGDLMFSNVSRWDPTEEDQVAYRRIDLAFLALVNYTDDCNRCEAAINDSEKPRSHFEPLLEQAEHTRIKAGELLEQARASPRTDIAIELAETTKLYLARLQKIKMQMLRDGIEPPGYAASLRKRAGIDRRPGAATASPKNEDKAHPSYHESPASSSSWVQVRYDLPAENSHSNQPTQDEPGAKTTSTCNAAHFKQYNKMFLDLELNLKEFIVEQQRVVEEADDFNDLIPQGPIEVFKQAKKYGEFLGDEIREARELQGKEYELLLGAVNDNLLGFLANDYRQDELSGARHCEKVIQELDTSLQTFLSNQNHLRDMENDLKVYLTNPDRQVKNKVLAEQCNKMCKDLEASMKEFLRGQSIAGDGNPTRFTSVEGAGAGIGSQTETKTVNEDTGKTLLGAEPKAATARQAQTVYGRNKFDARNYYFTIHGYHVPLWLLSLLAFVTVLFASYLLNRSALENFARRGWLEANSFSRVMYKTSWDDSSFDTVFSEGFLILWLGIVPLLIWLVKETGLLAVVRNKMAW